VREYECMFILPAEADEAMVSTAVDRVTKIIEPTGGTIGNVDRWGRRRFAFEIADQHEGYYVVLRFRADPSTQPELERVLNIADEVIRHKILVLPDKVAAKPAGTAAAASRSRAASRPPASAGRPERTGRTERTEEPKQAEQTEEPKRTEQAEQPEQQDEAASPAPA
jgi:small subunit ribosomal protein S6